MGNHNNCKQTSYNRTKNNIALPMSGKNDEYAANIIQIMTDDVGNRKVYLARGIQNGPENSTIA